jgi:hypothetical protein
MLIVKSPQNNKNATAYIRVSSQQQANKGVSIDAQKRRYPKSFRKLMKRVIVSE